MENFPGYYSSHNPRIEGELAKKRKAPSIGHMALVYERMVEQMGVEPTTYTMRTYRSSQLSYCPTKNVSINIHRYGKKARGIPFFFRKRLADRVPIAGFPGKTCTANLYRLGKIVFLPEKVMFRALFRIEALRKRAILDSRTGFRQMRTHPGPVFGISAADEIQKRGDFFRRRRSDAAVRPELVRRRHPGRS